MPALLAVFRIGRMPFPIPFPWFPVWLVLLPVALLAQITGLVAVCFTRKPWAALLSQSLRAWSLLPGLRGLKVDVRSNEERVLLSFL